MVSTSQQVQTSKDSPGGSGPSIEHLKMTRTLTNMHILKKDILGHSIVIGDNLLFTWCWLTFNWYWSPLDATEISHHNFVVISLLNQLYIYIYINVAVGWWNSSFLSPLTKEPLSSVFFMCMICSAHKLYHK